MIELHATATPSPEYIIDASTTQEVLQNAMWVQERLDCSEVSQSQKLLLAQAELTRINDLARKIYLGKSVQAVGYFYEGNTTTDPKDVKTPVEMEYGTVRGLAQGFLIMPDPVPLNGEGGDSVWSRMVLAQTVKTGLGRAALLPVGFSYFEQKDVLIDIQVSELTDSLGANDPILNDITDALAEDEEDINFELLNSVFGYALQESEFEKNIDDYVHVLNAYTNLDGKTAALNCSSFFSPSRHELWSMDPMVTTHAATRGFVVVDMPEILSQCNGTVKAGRNKPQLALVMEYKTNEKDLSSSEILFVPVKEIYGLSIPDALGLY